MLLGFYNALPFRFTAFNNALSLFNNTRRPQSIFSEQTGGVLKAKNKEKAKAATRTARILGCRHKDNYRRACR